MASTSICPRVCSSGSRFNEKDPKGYVKAYVHSQPYDPNHFPFVPSLKYASTQRQSHGTTAAGSGDQDTNYYVLEDMLKFRPSQLLDIQFDKFMPQCPQLGIFNDPGRRVSLAMLNGWVIKTWFSSIFREDTT